MYKDGCGSGESVVLAESAFEATDTFLQGLARGKRPRCKQTPCFFGHYEYPQGEDTARGNVILPGSVNSPQPRNRAKRPLARPRRRVLPERRSPHVPAAKRLVAFTFYTFHRA